jgi:PilZ domain
LQENKPKDSTTARKLPLLLYRCEILESAKYDVRRLGRMALKAFQPVAHVKNKAEGQGKNDYSHTFRIKIQSPLDSELMLINMEEELENAEVIIENIGPGGLRFLSNLILELDQEILYSIYSEILEDNICLPGVIIWYEKISDGLHQYGVHFETPEQSRPFLNQLFNVI